jgi:RNA polymerase sigma-70 factor, ECF subfamily
MDRFEEVYRRHFAGVWTALQRLGVERADLEDAVQDVFVVAHRRRDALTAGSSVRAWLLGISRRVASDHRRRRQRYRRRIDGLRRSAPAVAEPDDGLWRSEGARLLHGFLSALDEGKREIFVLVELEQLTGREAAGILGLNRNTAVARLRAARRAFDEYARGFQQSPPRLLAAARGGLRPEPQAQRRVLGLLMLRLGEGGIVPTTGVGGLASVGSWKAVAVCVVIAGASLGGIELGAAWWRAPPRVASRSAVSEARSRPGADVGGPEVVAVEPAAAAPVTRHGSAEAAATATATAPKLAAASGGEAAARVAVAGPARAEGEVVDPLYVQAQALGRARKALRDGDLEGALAIVGAVTRAHPAGDLAIELALVRIEALCAQGQRAQARGEARVLQRTHAGSPVAALASCPEPVEP